MTTPIWVDILNVGKAASEVSTSGEALHRKLTAIDGTVEALTSWQGGSADEYRKCWDEFIPYFDAAISNLGALSEWMGGAAKLYQRATTPEAT